MGNAPSSQRGGKAAQSETTLKEPTNANTPMDTAQVANITKEHLTISNPEDPKNSNTVPSKNAAALVSSTTCATHFAAKVAENATSTLSSPLGSVLHTGSPYPPEAVSPSLEGVTSPYTQDAPSRAQALDRNALSTVMKQTDARNSEVAVRPQKRPRRSRGRGRGKDADAPAPEETENIPPTNREDKPSHQRSARRPGRARNNSRPAAKRGRSEHRAGGTATVDSERITGTQVATEGASGGVPTNRSANAGRPRGNGRRPSAGFRSNSKAPRDLPSRAKADANAPGALAITEPIQDVVASTIEESGDTPEGDKDNAKTNDEDQVVPVQIAPPTNDTSTAPDKKSESMLMPEVDVSTVPPLPSSTRRRAKEYFQRRTRERSGSIDGETGPSGGATVAGEVASNPGFRTKEKAGNRKRPASWSVPVSHKKHDQFAFDPEASPFTPNATSSPRQGSLSSIGVQSFSSPSPLPPHGNRKVAPLTSVGTSGEAPEATDSSPQPIPVTPHDGQEYAYYPGRNHAQTHLQAEQLNLMRLQAYYSWLAGSMRATEHTDLSGGGGGLSGGVALGLGRQGGQGRGRGKAQSRHASAAYAHPKEHVVYSPREHEQAQLAPGLISQRDDGQPNPQKGEPDQEPDNLPEAAAQSTVQKWDGSWGLREGSGRVVGWSWGGNAERWEARR